MPVSRLQVEVRNLNRSLATTDFDTASLTEAIRQLRKFGAQFAPPAEPTV
jgi:hypothetical protein